MDNPKDKKEKSIIRYAIIFFIFLMVALSILYCAVSTAFSADKEILLRNFERRILQSDIVIPAIRGNIYTTDGKCLAVNMPVYSVFMDFRADGLNKKNLTDNLDSLSFLLAKHFPSKTKQDYKKLLLRGWKLGEKEKKEIAHKQKPKSLSRHIRIISRDISHAELKNLNKFPLFRAGTNRSGLIVETKWRRERPFGNMADRTIGNIRRDNEGHGYSGIELKYDSILYGVNGLKNRKKSGRRWINEIVKEPQDGMNIYVTLDPEIQSITESALENKMKDIDAESGCAIIMEVKSGEIKGIVNLDRVSPGVYREGNPNSFSYMNEPGSTFKTVTMLAALDKKFITPNDSFYVGNGVFKYGKSFVRDHYWRKGVDKGYLTAKEGFSISSNVVMAKIALKGYDKRKKLFVDQIRKMGFGKKLEWDVPLRGKEGTAEIRYPDDKYNPWSITTLPWMAFGYETQISPIYMLMFYNGIANDGKVVKPFIVKQIQKEGETIKTIETEVINKKMASDQALTEIRKMLKDVVENGTGKAVKSSIVTIAGKTGTAQISSYGRYGAGHYVSFCGFFPADQPQYTCFVGIRNPHIGYPSGGSMAGGVFKVIAENTYRNNGFYEYKNENADLHFPKMIVGDSKMTAEILDEFDYSVKDKQKDATWATFSLDEKDDHVFHNNSASQQSTSVVPNVLHMGLRDAVCILEQRGLRVVPKGEGKVVSQSLSPGQSVKQGSLINITLN